MCFSAEASFGASALITIAGIAAMRKSETLPQKVFSMIPLFFAFQQFIEGWLWVALKNPEYAHLTHILTMAFLVFAWLIWPVFVPLAMSMLEQNKKRKRVLLSFFAAGVLASSGFIYIMAFHNVTASIAQYHIAYIYDFHPPYAPLFGIFYLIPTVGSFFVSSIKKMWTLGVINMGSYLFSRIFFFGYVISVWCFFGAIASIFTLYIVYQLNKVKVEEEQQDEILINS